MLNKIIRVSLQNKVIVLLGTLILIIWGAVSFTQLPIDAIPDITNNQVQVLTVCPTLATQEVEQFITSPIEQSVKSIPGVVELRSISRFGLSVVTVVFEEDKDIFLCRQLMNEKLKEAESKIPPGFGSPELAPISTGLGEILHYRIEPKAGYENRYSASDLRTIQDWIVKKQLLGITGVVEINSFGGYLKQYEVAVTPDRLRSFGLGIQDVYNALQSANENSGGAYIEKTHSVYFIRSEGLVKNLDDIRQIVVKTPSGGASPILVGDVADVRFGAAPRYGAVSHNGEGEIVLGIVMMLKGENAADVIRRVKTKLTEVEQSLPEGIAITTFLDREKLVSRTISTVEKNLTEGALIVIFVLALLVGNMRAGFIIASVIPLSMLFALGLMRWLGVSANLMSLGAIDFGLVVDGAVIVVEATLHYLHTHLEHEKGYAKIRLTQEEMDNSVFKSSSKIMRSSVFGVIIILVVYLPILSLTGVEGKMFRPMAQTVSFALMGALLLSLTYVPVISALFLNKTIHNKPTLADKIIQACRNIYIPILKWAFHWKKTLVGLTLSMLLISLLLFMRMGGEFIPTLDEGDLMMHGFLRPGTSLTQTLESHRLAQKTILDSFPDEVEQVISKIGSAEIPTDPMAIETADNIILLREKALWKKAETKEELVEMIEKTVKNVPGMAFEFTQPIKMRFDEMMTGVRSDIAVKVFGENLDSLARLGHRVEMEIRDIPGIQDLKVEQIEGLAQINIHYNYAKMARFGVDVKSLNTLVRAAFAGAEAGVVFEDEKRFDLVVRLDIMRRQDIRDVQQLPVSTPGGQIVPLSELATVSFEPGAAQISRDNAQRRIVVTANVRGRDVESVIKDVQAKLQDSQKLHLPAGYFLTYGGQFENLQAAKARLSVAVPVALALIFVLLFFTFGGFKESLLIFTAIPLSAIGGIFALLMRGMPFSISAGVGFIALFGVAVLNGIVLISYFNQLEKEGVKDVYQRILQGATMRLRPVLMTAAVASLGFLPMAISHGSGAEVQRPLATVVIGGLVSSTLLTLIVLPVLYALFFNKPRKKAPSLSMILLLVLAGSLTQAQAQNNLNESQAIELALSSHPAIKSAEMQLQQQRMLATARPVWAPTELYHNIAADPDLGVFGTSTFGVSQAFPSGRRVRAQRDIHARQADVASAEVDFAKAQRVREVRELYRHLSYLEGKRALLLRLDSVYSTFASISDIRYRVGESGLLEQKVAAESAARVHLELATISHETEFDRKALGQLLGLPGSVTPIVDAFVPSSFSLADTTRIATAPFANIYRQKIALAQSHITAEKAQKAPVFTAGVNAQYLADGQVFPGYQLGVQLPLITKGIQQRSEAAALGAQSAQSDYDHVLLEQEMMLSHLLHEVEKYEIMMDYYEKQGRFTAAELSRTSLLNYRKGEIGYIEFARSIDQAIHIEMEYLDNLYGLNQTIIEIKSLLGE